MISRNVKFVDDSFLLVACAAADSNGWALVNGSSADIVQRPWFANVALIDYLAYGSATALVE